MSQTEPASRDDEISLLDLLVIVAENWLWLVLVPLALGVASYAFLALQPIDYRLSASIPAPAGEVAAFLEGPEGQAVLLGAEDELTVGAIEPGDTTELSVVSREPDVARQRLSAVTGAIQQALEAGELVRPVDRRAERVADLQAAIAVRSRAIGQLQETLGGRAEEGDEQAYALAALALAELLNGREAELDRLEELRAAGVDSSTETVRAAISVDRPGRSPLLVAGLLVFGSGILMLLIILVRHGIKSAAKTPETRRKLDRIKNGLLLRRHPEDGRTE